jgi:acylphosphatase
MNFVRFTLQVESAPIEPLLFRPLYPMADVHHETVYFSGHVQGVGFRYTTLSVAKEFELTGRVSNLADGRVLLDVEGAPKEINAFLAVLEERMHGYIRKVERSSSQGPAQYQDFCIQ